MKKLFHELVSVDENRSIAVEELPCGGFGIRGTSYNPMTEELFTSVIHFSPEGTKVLTEILNRIPKEEGKDV